MTNENESIKTGKETYVSPTWKHAFDFILDDKWEGVRSILMIVVSMKKQVRRLQHFIDYVEMQFPAVAENCIQHSSNVYYTSKVYVSVVSIPTNEFSRGTSADYIIFEQYPDIAKCNKIFALMYHSTFIIVTPRNSQNLFLKDDKVVHIQDSKDFTH